LKARRKVRRINQEFKIGPPLRGGDLTAALYVNTNRTRWNADDFSATDANNTLRHCRTMAGENSVLVQRTEINPCSAVKTISRVFHISCPLKISANYSVYSHGFSSNE
jgi:hypothetical protein